MKQAVWLAAALMMLLPLGKVYSKERSERENNTLRIMSYNIRNGRGMDDVADFRRMLSRFEILASSATLSSNSIIV